LKNRRVRWRDLRPGSGSRVAREVRRAIGDVPGDSNMKVTTSPASSAFIVMMSSLSAHFSILDCGGMTKDSGAVSACFSGTAGGRGTEGEVSRSAGVREAAHIAGLVERVSSATCPARAFSRPTVETATLGRSRRVSSSRDVSSVGKCPLSNNAFSQRDPETPGTVEGRKGDWTRPRSPRRSRGFPTRDVPCWSGSCPWSCCGRSGSARTRRCAAAARRARRASCPSPATRTRCWSSRSWRR